MKKIFITLIALSAGLWMNAQSVDDAYLFSQNNYSGSARTVGMGNAVTAVGGDIGSLGFNPAGSAVSSYSQFAISPGISVSSTNSVGTPLGGSTPYSFEYSTPDDKSKLNMPNFGFILNFDTHNRSGIKSWSMGLVGSATNNFLNTALASGTNANTTYMGYLSAAASGRYTFDELDSSNAFYNGIPWDLAVGAQSGMISTYGGMDDQYLGTSEALWHDPASDEDVIGIPSDSYLNQVYGRYTYGNKYDFITNFGANIQDIVYLGVNLGITTLNYNSVETIMESADDPMHFGLEFEDGFVAYWKDMQNEYTFQARGTGIYAKIGFIAKPIAGLRIGAAIQTPTRLDLTETWGIYGETTYTNIDKVWAGNDDGYQKYSIRSPYRANVGVAYTFGKLGLVSADYEFCDYSTMAFKSSSNYDGINFIDLNSSIKETLGVSHMLRIGAEVRPLPQFAIRAGYNLTTNPYKDNLGNYDSSIKRQSISAGLGYSSAGSFFADIAYRHHLLPDNLYYPYPDYIEGVLSPEIRTRNKLFDVVATIGFRF